MPLIVVLPVTVEHVSVMLLMLLVSVVLTTVVLFVLVLRFCSSSCRSSSSCR